MSKDHNQLVVNRPYKPRRRRTIGAAYSCRFCTFVTRTGPAVLSYHLQSHLGTRHCPVCGVSAASKPALHQHIARRHIHPDMGHSGDKSFVDKGTYTCSRSCKVCRMVKHYDRRVFDHCCFLCDYSDPNPMDLYHHVMMGHVHITKSRETNTPKSRETAMSGLTEHPPKLSSGIGDFVSQVKDGGENCNSVHVKTDERHQGDGLLTPPQELRTYGKRKSPPVSPLADKPTTNPLKKRRRVFLGSGNSDNCPVPEHTPTETAATSHNNMEWSEELSPAFDRQSNGGTATVGPTYNVGFCSVWVPMALSPPVLHQEVPLDLSLSKAKATPTDTTENTMPVITSVFSWKDYI
ncbi:PREDICTED: uncharacterized protein LOC109464186 [Branchiostoma belcheri]|uniref:Uncharacterized protein LOC109464186 n=1 Tax=Branchiostoma belcheri TaxID=7741 RepID=A0A6P4Y2P6_BRABE|nr:PREDICTED: uncharacterized protein LOC109464186 [Branchiostoma belcheri]